ncbi:MAG: hypothetical protein GVY13_06190 [Alphaproteobacteria bacterium]|jgi:hypothetical protein|nr:hypothetical protein [Alphaproteobacteria bacterium]
MSRRAAVEVTGPGRGAAIAAALAVALAWPATGAAQQQPGGPDGDSAGPVRIVPAERPEPPEPPQRQQQGPARVTLDRGLVATAGAPLWIVDAENNRLIACVYERTAGAPRINCVTRSLP